MSTYKNKTIYIEAVQWNGKNVCEIEHFVGRVVCNSISPEVELKIESNNRACNLKIGDFISKIDGRIEIFSENEFNKLFEIAD